jgi:type I restriction enzyme R subunit
MTLNKSIVEDAAFEWFLLRSAPLNYGGQVGALDDAIGHLPAPRSATVGHGPHLAPGEPAAERESFSEVVLVGRLREGHPAAESGHSRRGAGSYEALLKNLI